MSIVVVCQNCRKRFKVSEKFAGRRGPCPNCKNILQIPTEDEQVKIHTPEHSEEGARGKSGELVLKPISREDRVWPLWAIIGVGVAALVVVVVAFILRPGEGGEPNRTAAVIGLMLLTPPLVAGGYSFLRDDELAPYSGLWLWIRTAICSAIYIGCWVAYGYVPLEWKNEFYKWFFLAPVFGVIGATASFASLDLDYSSAFFHFCFYAGVIACLGLIMGCL